MDDTTHAKEPQEAETPSHLARLPGGAWSIWRWTAVRAAGFAATDVLRLAAEECVQAAQRLVRAEEQDARSRTGVRASEAPKGGNESVRDPLHVDPPTPLQNDNETSASFLPAGVGDLRGPSLDSLRTAFTEEFLNASVSLSHVLHEVAASERFREAVTWQNRQAIHSGIDRYLATPPGDLSHGAKRRERENLIASYLQRYCLKNDTIGFFGPVGWAKFADDGDALFARPGKELLSRRTVYLDVWGLDELARALSASLPLQPWIAPRAMPYVFLEGTTLQLPLAAPVELPPGQAALLRACDGQHTAKEMARDMVRTHPGEFSCEEDVYRVLEQLAQGGLIATVFEVPMEMHAEQWLTAALKRIEDEELRSQAMGAVDALLAARDQVARASGSAGRVDEALAGLEATFIRLTDQSATRSPGKLYAGRMLVFEDCIRDIEMRIGPAVLEALGPPLSLLLSSARWITYRAAAIYQGIFQQVYAGLCAQLQSTSIDFAVFWAHAEKVLFDEEESVQQSLTEEFQRNWEKVLSLPLDMVQATFECDRIRERVLDVFNAPGPGWSWARYHSPDLMIAADSLEAINQGRFDLVLGEMHVGVNTLGLQLFFRHHPSPEQLSKAYAEDMPEPRVVPVVPKAFWPGGSWRLLPGLVSEKDYRLLLAPDPVGMAIKNPLPIGSLVVEMRQGELVARTRDDRSCFAITEVLADLLSSLVTNCFKLIGRMPHTPRVRFDRLIVCREAWNFSPASLTFAFKKSEEERFLEATRWSLANGMPRFMFIKAPTEMKPFYLDWNSPVSVNIFSKVIRHCEASLMKESPITLSEMIPDPRQLWLPDAQGKIYTSEFRCVVLDPAMPTGPRRVTE